AARLLVGAGRPLLLCDLHQDRLAQTAAELAGDVQVLAGDISDPDYCARFITALNDRPVAALIHCAGLSPTMGSAERILEVNLAATMRLVAAVRSRMVEGGAAVLFASLAAHQIGNTFDTEIGKATTPDKVASLIGISPNPGMAYSIAKRGVYLLARREAKAFG